MDNQEQEVIVACVPKLSCTEAKDFPDLAQLIAGQKPNVGTTIIKCPRCGREMYLGARGKALVDSGVGKCMCMICCHEVMEDQGGIQEVRHLGGSTFE